MAKIYSCPTCGETTTAAGTNLIGVYDVTTAGMSAAMGSESLRPSVVGRIMNVRVVAANPIRSLGIWNNLFLPLSRRSLSQSR
jgi:hypothetical protein